MGLMPVGVISEAGLPHHRGHRLPAPALHRPVADHREAPVQRGPIQWVDHTAAAAGVQCHPGPGAIRRQFQFV